MRADEMPIYYNAVDILERNLPGRRDKVALLTPAREMTFGQVSEEVNRVGNALERIGVRAGETVALLVPDSAEWVTSFFGIIKIGAVALSMNTLLKPYDQSFILRDSGARVLIVHESLLAQIEPIREEADRLEHIIVIGKDVGKVGEMTYADWIANESAKLAPARTHRDDFCCLNYSSGTTGEPKGIFHAQKDLPLTAQRWGVDVLGLRESDRTFAAAKLFFTFGTGGNLIFPWYVGASIVLLAGPPRIAANVLSMIDKFKPTIHYNSPTGYAAMLASPDFAKFDLSSLRLCVSAGEALPAPIWHQWKERTGVDIIDGIGSTEVYHIFISNRPGDIRPGSTGKPVDGYEVKLIDENGQAVKQGEVGNLMLKGDTSALFYLHRYERSKRTFQGEWLATGDKYVVDEDGYYWHAGRSDDMLKVGGIWVSPVEVESALISHPCVLECAVVGAEDSAGLVKPKAYVVLKEGNEPADALKEELISYCRTKIADYKRPRWVEFVPELPKTATGKIQRFRLRE